MERTVFENLSAIKRRIDDKVKDSKENKTVPEDISWRPQTVSLADRTIPEFTIPASRKRQSTKERLSKVLAFIDCNKSRRIKSYTEATVMPIPMTNRRYISICGNYKEVQRLIDFMKQLGLIELYSDKKIIGKQSYTYLYYYKNEECIKEYCSRNNINIYNVSNVNNRVIDSKVISNEESNVLNTLFDIFRFDAFDEKQVRFSSTLELLKPNDLSITEFEDKLTEILYKNYPDLLHYQLLADKINSTFYKDYPDFRIVFKPKFTWNSGHKAVIKIGIRASNFLCNIKKEHNGKDIGKKIRQDILDEYELTLEKDVKSSVPRLTASINYGCFITEDIDFYELIFDRLKELNIDEILNSTEEDLERITQFINNLEYDTFIREILKSYMLRGYFDNNVGVDTRRAMCGNGEKEYVDQTMHMLQQAITDVCGYRYGSEIFYYESVIYMDVLNHLLNEGYIVWECYDSWYGYKEGITQEEYENYVGSLVEFYVNKYIKNTQIERIAA